jgi:hypothetical protein
MTGPTLPGAIDRVRKYLAAFSPEYRIVGRQTAFGQHFHSDEWEPNSYPLRREDIELLLEAAAKHHACTCHTSF